MVVTAVIPDESNDERDLHPQRKDDPIFFTFVNPDVSNATMLLSRERNRSGIVLPSSTHIEMRHGSLIQATALRIFLASVGRRTVVLDVSRNA